MSYHQDLDHAGDRVEKALELARKITHDPHSRAFPSEDTRDVARMILWEARKGSKDVPENVGKDDAYDDLMEENW